MSTHVNETLKPCPFCGSDACSPDSVLRAGYEDCPNDPDARAFTIRCLACAAESGWSKNAAGAVRLWNSRVTE